jgi:EAL domain-containing protein (putative c-di-GMP-specific phosphodiesterase class I)
MDDKFLERMDSQLAGWADPVERLRHAIERNEFSLYCQPILSLGADGGYPMGEVLIRMREEESALLPPGDFLPVFEHYRMMPQLDRWVVRNTLALIVRGSRIPRFTVNVSSQSLADPEFPAYVASQHSLQKVAPDRLLFEIDESDALEHGDAAQAFAAACRKTGSGIMIDGFGRRAVSFSVLKGIAVNFLKVDGGITRKVLANETARNKMNAVLRVSDALGFGVVAECVEDQNVLTRLKALGVSHAQGFGIYQPQPIEKVAGS